MARTLTAMPASAGRPRVGQELLRRWQELAARERGMLLLMVLAIGGAALWVGWWEPLQKQRVQLQAELPRLRAQQRQLHDLLATLQRQRTAAVITAASLRTRLTEAGLQQQATLSESPTQWQLAVREAPADTLWNALLPVLANPAVQVQELTLERTGNPNMAAARVSGTIVMKRNGSGGAR
ncbi:MAG: type II secretion system protein GspM [Stenotrophomonas sp.]|uniref:type II secretion system protein GspM n=1 Tax=Stenotrophomonas sp. TaxID=69392 RepID=UPI003D6D2C50